MRRRDIWGLALGALAVVPITPARAMSLTKLGSVSGAVPVQERREERCEMLLLRERQIRERLEIARGEQREDLMRQLQEIREQREQCVPAQERREERCERLQLRAREIRERLKTARGEQREDLMRQLQEIREQQEQCRR